MNESGPMTSAKESTNEAASDPRIAFAAERTLLAWIRTGLALMGFGFVTARFGLFLRELAAAEHVPPHHSASFAVWTGIGLITIGVMVNVLAAVQHVRIIRWLRSGRPWELRASSLGIALTIVLAVIGIGLTTYLAMATR